MSKSSEFSPAERRNWGYWDGVADAESGKWAPWCTPRNAPHKHPCDKPYGEGYWAGRYGQPHPNLAGSK